MGGEGEMITKNYINMCEKAKEIQKSDINVGKRHFNNQDFVAYNFGEGLKVYVCAEVSRYWQIEDLIWLPTQEQLQEMILTSKKYTDMFILNNLLSDFMIDNLDKENRVNMNEIWLAFVMEERWNKIWSDKQWKKAVK